MVVVKAVVGAAAVEEKVVAAVVVAAAEKVVAVATEAVARLPQMAPVLPAILRAVDEEITLLAN